MSITFEKRQKELKRQEKQKAKAARREQRKVAKRAAKEAQVTPTKPSLDTEERRRSEGKHPAPAQIDGHIGSISL